MIKYTDVLVDIMHLLYNNPLEAVLSMRPNEYQQVELMLYLILSLVGFLPKQTTDSSPFTRLGKLGCPYSQQVAGRDRETLARKVSWSLFGHKDNRSY